MTSAAAVSLQILSGALANPLLAERRQSLYTPPPPTAPSSSSSSPDAASAAPSHHRALDDYDLDQITVERFENVDLVGEGAYGSVYHGVAPSGLHVALKKVRLNEAKETEGFPSSILREVSMLMRLNHRCIVSLLDVVPSAHEYQVADLDAAAVYLVLEYLNHDLCGLLYNPQVALPEIWLASMFAQVLEGLAYLHAHGVLHLDLKAPNVLVSDAGAVKLTDFGLATASRWTPDRRNADHEGGEMSNRVVTIWYRAPELLFGATKYGGAVDMWAAGCIFYELFARKALFRGSNEPHQVHRIMSVCGVPDDPATTSLPLFDMITTGLLDHEPELKTKPGSLRAHVRERVSVADMSESALDLLERLLAYDPDKRLTAAQALQHPYFAQFDFSDMPPFPSVAASHQFQVETQAQQTSALTSKSRAAAAAGAATS